jgi:8-oxo-dGTP pyrophosphatase MutT (NUDIX family)
MSYLLELRALVGSRPLIAVGADVMVLEGNRLLLQERRDDGLWSLPGGAMEPGESLAQTAARELLEETGLRARRLELVTVCSGAEYFHRYPNGDEIFNVTAIFVAQDPYGAMRVDPSEGRSLRSFPIDGLPPMASAVTRMVAAALDLLRR